MSMLQLRNDFVNEEQQHSGSGEPFQERKNKSTWVLNVRAWLASGMPSPLSLNLVKNILLFLFHEFQTNKAGQKKKNGNAKLITQMLITSHGCVDRVVVGIFTTTNMCYCISPALASLMLLAPHSSEQHVVAAEGITL